MIAGIAGIALIGAIAGIAGIAGMGGTATSLSMASVNASSFRSVEDFILVRFLLGGEKTSYTLVLSFEMTTY